MEEEDKLHSAIASTRFHNLFFKQCVDLKAPFPTAATTTEKKGAAPFPDFPQHVGHHFSFAGD